MTYSRPSPAQEGRLLNRISIFGKGSKVAFVTSNQTKVTRTHFVANNIKEKIIQGDISPAQKIDIDALAQEFQVSRIPVREALLVLKREGLVTYEPTIGAKAIHVDLDQIEELFRLKKLLSSHLLLASLPYISEDKLNEAKHVLIKLGTTTSATHWCQYNQTFFHCLYSGVDKPKTIELLTTLAIKITQFERLFFANTKYKLVIHTTYRNLIDCCQQKNAEKALNQLHQLLSFSMESIKNIYKK